MTTPNEPTQHQPASGPLPVAPGMFPQVPDGQFTPPSAGQFQPPPVPKRRASWLLPTFIGVGAFVLLCCGGAFALSLTADDKKTDTAAISTDASAGAGGAIVASAPAAPESVAAPSTAAVPKPATTTAAPKPSEPKGPGIGEKVRGGDFEFTVKSVKCGISQVGNEFLNTKAQGTFCRVSVTVKNVTKKAHPFHADGSISAKDGSGREYEVDGEAGIYGNDDGQGFLDEINPGNSVTANVYFDVPKGTKLKTITLDAGLLTLAEDAVVTL
ncbi:DUF4352 domain-containing protein [Micromonospora sp. NPDC049102]|uniref:DUF4352 domain-containing protein n=1 Tax=Micromonospora sp. NPDC049102 TaxID=3364265 RepID=UPI0037217AA9